MKIELSDTEKERFSQWVIENINDNNNIVPPDEGNGDALIFNLVHAIRGDNECYNYTTFQDEELKSWGLGYED